MTCETRCPKCGSYRKLVVRESYDYEVDDEGVAYADSCFGENPIHTVHCQACGQEVTGFFGIEYEDGAFTLIPEHLKGNDHDQAP